MDSQEKLIEELMRENMDLKNILNDNFSNEDPPKLSYDFVGKTKEEQREELKGFYTSLLEKLEDCENKARLFKLKVANLMVENGFSIKQSGEEKHDRSGNVVEDVKNCMPLAQQTEAEAACKEPVGVNSTFCNLIVQVDADKEPPLPANLGSETLRQLEEIYKDLCIVKSDICSLTAKESQ